VIAAVRRRTVPTRDLGDRLVVARPRDGAPVVIGPTATLVWAMAADWIAPAEIDRRLAGQFPEIAEQERASAVAETIAMLGDEGLLDRR
jgi:hypothetical protein